MWPQRRKIVGDGVAARVSSRSVAGWAALFQLFNRLVARFSRYDRARADQHVGQPKQRVELMSVLGQSPVTHFSVAE